MAISRRMGVDVGALHSLAHHESKRHAGRRLVGSQLDAAFEVAKIRAQAGRVPLHLVGVNRSLLYHVFRHRRFPARETKISIFFFLLKVK